MPTIVGILTFMSGINFSISSVEHEKSFITGVGCVERQYCHLWSLVYGLNLSGSTQHPFYALSQCVCVCVCPTKDVNSL